MEVRKIKSIEKRKRKKEQEKMEGGNKNYKRWMSMNLEKVE